MTAYTSCMRFPFWVLLLEMAVAAQVNTLSECEKALGFELLFDGTRESFAANFVQWISGYDANTNLPATWTVSDSDRAVYSRGGTPDLRSRRKYADFDLRLDYRNSGSDRIYYRMLTRGSFAWSTATEFSIDNNTQQFSLKMTAGSVYDLFAPNPPAAESYHKYATGNWNQVRIVSKGDSVEHWMNGRKVAGFRYWNDRWNEAYQNSKWQGSLDKSQESPGCRCPISLGYVGFQGDWDGTWHIRNLRISSDSARVAFGPDACVTAVRPAPARSPPQFLLQYGPKEIRILFPHTRATAIEAMGLDGRPMAGVELLADGSHASIRGWDGPALALLRIQFANGNRIHRKVNLP